MYRTEITTNTKIENTDEKVLPNTNANHKSMLIAITKSAMIQATTCNHNHLHVKFETSEYPLN